MEKTNEELALESYMASITEKKLAVSDNRLLGNAKRRNNPNWRKNQTQALLNAKETEHYKNSFDKAMHDRKQNPEYKKQAQEAVKRRDSNPGRLTEQADIMRNVRAHPDYKEKMQALHASEEWLSKNREKARKTYKPFVCPQGIFNSLKECVIYFIDNNVLPTRANRNSIVKWLNTKIKQEPTAYYYISQEEYIMLTGKDI